jgi:ArsR family transcriptional regulator
MIQIIGDYITLLVCNKTVTDLGKFKAEFFKALAHPLRIAILDELRGGEIGVNELSGRLGVEQSSLSQQLAVLRSRNIVIGRKEGLNVYYSVRDSTVFKLLEVAKQIFNNHLIDVRAMLSKMSARPVARRR